jgi:hypothetical protein
VSGLAAHQPGEMLRLARIAAKQAMLAELPEVVGPRHCRTGELSAICRICFFEWVRALR